MKNHIIPRTFMMFIWIWALSAGANSSRQPDQTNLQLPDFAGKYQHTKLGENVFVFSPGMDMQEVQTLIDVIADRQTGNDSEFSRNRYALLFSPGTYKLDIRVGYYMQVMGLGASPEDVIIEGAVRSNTRRNSVLTNFWRGVENLTIIPSTDSTNTWGVSQAAPLRRVCVRGNLNLFDRGYASGGFMANCSIEGTVSSGPQQQWLSRNTRWHSWSGGVWNMMFVGIQNPPDGTWPESPFTTIEETPMVREKPYLTMDGGALQVKVPALKRNAAGPDWLEGTVDEKDLAIDAIYMATPVLDNAASLNEALQQGRHILFTPGIYTLEASLKITHPGTLVMGIGMPSLVPLKGNAVIEVSDVDGVTLSGILIDAGSVRSDVLLQVGPAGAVHSHEIDPTFLHDVFVRVGGPSEGSAVSCVVINSHDVCIDHIWLWRADHGNGVGWERNKAANGLVVNGDQVTAYGLFNEHFQEYQTIWNGENGRVFFYQSEMPYDPPSAEAWTHDGINGYASYKVAGHVKTHEAWGLGIYNVFYDAPVVVDNAIEAPVSLESSFHHVVTYWLNGHEGSIVKSIINGKGGSVSQSSRKATLD
jgi:hypothetical protein